MRIVLSGLAVLAFLMVSAWFYFQTAPRVAGVSLNIVGYTNDASGIKYARLQFTNGSTQPIRIMGTTNTPPIFPAWVIYQQSPDNFNIYDIVPLGQPQREITIQPGEDIFFSAPLTNKGPHSVSLSYLPVRSSRLREFYRNLHLQIFNRYSVAWAKAQTPFVKE